MRVAFHAPLKPPDDPRPSGDRTMARALVAALRLAGHEVEIACRFSSFDGRGDARRQARLAALGERLAAALILRYLRRPAERRPQLWFTYHLHHKAPDRLGPAVSRALAIPYVVAEASHAPKQAEGPWAAGHQAARAAIGRADAIIGLNSADRDCVLPLLTDPGRYHALVPFLDTRPWRAARERRARFRADLARRFGLDPALPWLVAVAMMRPGDKLASYRVLGHALARLQDRPWRLVVAGDGPARAEVEAALASLAPRVAWLGETPRATLPGVLAACDLLVWPAIGEAYGLALLEAQAAGLPVVAGRTGGVGDIVADGASGLLVPVGDASAFAQAVAQLLDRPAARFTMGRRAAARAADVHDPRAAARRLDAIVRSLVS